MSNKKTSKKSKPVKATVVVPTFNKKNAIAFGENIFSAKDGMISCVKLCDGELQNGKDGKRTMHCAVGEAYATFVNPSLRTVLRKDQLTHSFYGQWTDGTEGSTAAAIDALVETANLKNNTDEGRKKLGAALSRCVASNDNGSNNGDVDPTLEYIIRAQKVATTWKEEVVPLLK